MSFSELIKKNTIVRLAIRIFRHFDTVPAAITIDNYRFYIISNIAYTLAWAIHAGWFFLFLVIKQYTMMEIQPLSILCHVIAINLNRRGRHQPAMVIGMLEVVGHQVLATYLLGWNAGFQYIIAAITLFPFLKHDGSKLLKFLLTLLCMTSYLFLEIFVRDNPPVFQLSPGLETFFNYSNIILCFAFMATWGFFLTVAIQRTEAVLDERNKALFEAEKAKETAEIQRQLEVKERDMEIYRLRNVELKRSYDEIAAQNKIIEEEKKRSEELLLNILPEETARELLREGHAQSRRYDLVTVMFTDFVGFTNIAERQKAEDLVQQIDRYFRAFDEITLRYGVEKIKTIGDAYMCVGGLPTANRTNPVDVLNAALEIMQFMNEERGDFFKLRVGIHTGPVVAGVVGKHKFQYDIWGDAVNVAARMEQSSVPGKINISGTTFELVKHWFECEYRGKIPAKHKGELEMYFVNGKMSMTDSGIMY